MFLIKQDLIDTLNSKDIAILSTDESTITRCINKAVIEAKTFIQHRYDESKVFVDMPLWVLGTEYTASDFVYYYLSTAYVATTTYSTGDRVIYSDKVYKSKVDNNTGHQPDTSTTQWEYICDNYAKFICQGDTDTVVPGDDTDYWIENDKRDPLIIDCVSIIALHKLFRKGQPRTLPEWLLDEFDRVNKILKEIGNGTRTLILDVAIDEDGEEEGHNIIYGSEEQKDWNI